MTRTSRCRILYERNALPEAAEVLRSVAEMSGRLSPDEHEDLAAEWLARVRVARGDPGDDTEVELEPTTRQEYRIHLFDAPSYHRLCWRLAAGDAEAVEAELRRRSLDPHTASLDPAREREHVLLARALIARRRAADALPLLARLLMATVAGGRPATALEALCAQAVARHLQGSTPQAQESLRQALELAGDEGWVRVFVDVGPPMQHLLAKIRGGEGGAVVEHLLAAFGEEHPGTTSAVAPLVEPIRERELDVLRCLAAGMSDPEIAAQLYLSPNTVKTHVRHLHGKLGVQKRSDALRRAREPGLIGG